MTDPNGLRGRTEPDLATSLRIAPERYVLEDGAIEELGRRLNVDGDVSSVRVLGGERALSAVRDELDRSLERAGIPARYATFEGECCPSAIAGHRDRLDAQGADVLIGVGGGKALDAAKLVAEGRCPVAAVPTSAATCAAWTPLSVVYEPDGTYRTGVVLSRCPKLVVADVGVIADAPVRLLASGILDATAKHFETRLLGDTGRPATRWGLGIATETYADTLREHAATACADAEAGRVTPELTAVVEASIAGPGLTAGLMADRSYITLPHVFCYALLGYGSTATDSYHGERVAYGVVALQALLEDDSTPASIDSPVDLRELASWYESLGVRLDLEWLGVEDDVVEDVAADVVDGLGYEILPETVSAGDVAAAIRRVEGLDTDSG